MSGLVDKVDRPGYQSDYKARLSGLLARLYPGRTEFTLDEVYDAMAFMEDPR